MEPVTTAPTRDRSVVGILIEMALSMRYYLPASGWDETALPHVEARLAERPCYASRPFEDVVFPNDAAPTLLAARWSVVGAPDQGRLLN